MTLESPNDRPASLSDFRTALVEVTHGRIRDLTIRLYGDGWVVIRGDAGSYYGVQLAIHAIKRFVGTHQLYSQVQLVLSVDGKRLEFVIAPVTRENVDTGLSTRGDNRRSRLTDIAPA